jgi:dTDP-glucose 4,6-dehydratase
VIGEAYNIGANDERRNIEVARRIVKILGKARDLIRFVPDRLGHDWRYALNCRKLRALGWEPEVPFEVGLERTVKWYIENEAWWRKIKEQSAEYKSFYDVYYKDRK